MRLPSCVLCATLASLLASGCKKETEQAAPKVIASNETPPGPGPNAGIHPDDFKCEMIAALPAVSEVIGQLVEVEFSVFPAPSGVPRGCNYYPITAVMTDAGRVPSWSFDLDCRRSALGAAGSLMAQYSADPAAVPVEVGKSGIDHRDTLLLFVDDDAPCYVRVLGPGRDIRIALGKVIAEGLGPTNAPSIK